MPTIIVGEVNGSRLQEKERKELAGLSRKTVVNLDVHRSFLLALTDRPRDGEALFLGQSNRIPDPNEEGRGCSHENSCRALQERHI